MFQKLHHTDHPPEKPILIWDGQCGFCKYWVIRWKMMTGNKVEYAPFQEVAKKFPDIEERHFRQAARLIEPSGRIYDGPEAAYKTLTYAHRWTFLYDWYQKNALFRHLSDHAYQWIADHRPFMGKLTVGLFGKDPRHLQHYWMIYLGVVVLLFFLLS